MKPANDRQVAFHRVGMASSGDALLDRTGATQFYYVQQPEKRDRTRILKGVVIIATMLLGLALANSPEKKAAVFTFEGNGISYVDAAFLTNQLRNELSDLGAFSVVRFQHSGWCATDACRAEVGKFIGVQKIIGGSVSKVRNQFTVSAWILDVQTGQLTSVDDYEFKGTFEELRRSGLKSLAYRLAEMEPQKPAPLLSAARSIKKK